MNFSTGQVLIKPKVKTVEHPCMYIYIWNRTGWNGMDRRVNSRQRDDDCINTHYN